MCYILIAIDVFVALTVMNSFSIVTVMNLFSTLMYDTKNHILAYLCVFDRLFL